MSEILNCYYCKMDKPKKEFKKYSIALKTKRGKCLKCHALKSKEWRNMMKEYAK